MEEEVVAIDFKVKIPVALAEKIKYYQGKMYMRNHEFIKFAIIKFIKEMDENEKRGKGL
jgi:hypothetical protein